MKYVVIYSLNTSKSAFVFDEHDDAVDYINECTDRYGQDRMVELTSYSADSHKMVLKNGQAIKIDIKAYPDRKVRFDLSYDKNGKHIETRRFTKRSYAVNFANRILEELDSEADKNEDEFGEWTLNDPDRSLNAHLTLSLVILGDKEKSDYDTLEINSNASDEEVKRAFRKMAIKYHPDKGGDPKKFQKIHEAYERIMSGASKSVRPEIMERYDNMDMRCFFSNVDELEKKALEENKAMLEPILTQIRLKASGLMVRGLVELLLGGGLTAATYNASTNGRYIIFTGLIFVGIYNLIKGLYYLSNPRALLDKLK